MRSNTDAKRRSPADEPNNSILTLAPPLLDIDEEVLEVLNLVASVGQLELDLVPAQLFLRLINADTVLHPGFARHDLLLETRDGGQVVPERRRAHDHDLLLWHGL